MSEFKFSCSNCGQHLSGDDSWRGMQIVCPSCTAAIVVPQMASAPVAGLKISGPAMTAAPPPILAQPQPARHVPGIHAQAPAQRATVSAGAIVSLILVLMTIPAN